MYVLGTAGHVDHGKSTLVHALTGINPDRLAEEQRREMTIDLGFAHFTLPNGKQVGIVDVPGHERFIKNMLAGIGGIDAVLLIIAADEGIMPQTTEHLHILDLLGVERGVVVLTKCDTVDEAWLQLVREDAEAHLAPTSMTGAPLVAVSARTGAGLDELRHVLEEVLAHTPSRTTAQGVPRLPIDRVFTVGGFGTVVTGTLSDGPLIVGQEIEIQPRGLRGRVRGLQTHGAKQEHALPGTRVALNIAGVAAHAISRGDVVTLPDHFVSTTLLDLKLQLVRDAPHVLHQNDLLDLFVYTTETPCRVTLLDAEQLELGEAGWVQLRLERPIVVQRGDHCIVRIPSPSVTIGGGVVVDAHPRHHRRFRAALLDALETQRRGTPADLLLHVLGAAPAEWTQTVRVSGLALATALAAWNELRSTERVLNLDDDGPPDAHAWVITTDAWRALLHTMITTVGAYHERWPLRVGMSREELKSKLHLPSARAFDNVLRRAEGEKHLVVAGTHVHLPAWTPQPTPDQLRQATTLLEHLRAAPFMPPPKAEWEGLGGELLTFLAERGEIVRVSSDVIFAAEAYRQMVGWTENTLATAGDVVVAQLRDRFGTSRKYALALLEHLDERRITRRRGDVRVKY